MKDKPSKFPRYDNSEIADSQEYENIEDIEDAVDSDEDLEEALSNKEELEDGSVRDESLKDQALVDCDNDSESDLEDDEITEEERSSIEEDTLFRERKRRATIRVLAGGYLLYICYDGVISPLIKGTYDTPLHFAIAFVAFGILGIVFIVNGIKNMK